MPANPDLVPDGGFSFFVLMGGVLLLILVRMFSAPTYVPMGGPPNASARRSVFSVPSRGVTAEGFHVSHTTQRIVAFIIFGSLMYSLYQFEYPGAMKL
jgi:hypothetical protein